MSDLAEFDRRLEERFADAQRALHWTPEEAEQYMAEVAARREQFEQLALSLNDMVIRPRVQKLASHFSNAALTEGESPGRCSCWFNYSERFPATMQVAFAVEHDVRIEKLIVSFEARMMPTFIKFDEHDKLTVQLDAVKAATLAEWVEERLLEFLEAVLRIDRGGKARDAETAADPVCGMRIRRAGAASTADYRGILYYFCSTACRDKFTEDPTAYVRVKAL